jgi:putative hydrolase of the HAD superfamily
MKKAILFDADGVVLKKQAEYFSVRFAREHGAPQEELREFFKTTFLLCQKGQADLKQELTPLLPKWGWDKDPDAFLKYWFTTDVALDEEVLKEVAQLRAKGITCYLATDQEKYRAEYLRKRMGLDGMFDGTFFSCELGFTKSESGFFNAALNQLKLPAADVAYLDDDKENVGVAKELGIDARFYSGINDLKLDEPKIPIS